MEGDTKRKWRWSSKSAIASSRPSKVVVVDRSMLDTHDAAADRVGVTEISLDGCSMEDGHERSGMAARMRRHGSRFLSIVGLQRSTGMFFSLVQLFLWLSFQPLTVIRTPEFQVFVKSSKRARCCAGYR